jgi:hypothetical protein
MIPNVNAQLNRIMLANKTSAPAVVAISKFSIFTSLSSIISG